MRLTPHAYQRWRQRCSHLDPDLEMAGLKRAGKGVINRLRRSWERAQGVGTWPAHQTYLVGPNGTLFIVVDGFVLSVMLVRDIKRWDSRRCKEDRTRRKHGLV